jgi:ADP-ribosylglycohydrolase
VNKDNLGCGALMRIIPFAIWSFNLNNYDLLEKAVTFQTMMTHSHPTIIEACYLYCRAIKFLLMNRGDMEGAYKSIKNEAENRVILKDWFELIESPNAKDELKKQP